ncbi:hypothetical protein KIL84_000447 [Mauremys mutica]|uniref:Uncharacterized protein n=1 Tax=Mauremys mutica TaxID=74926 RepID=A0A9D4B3J7_9SAUR|nr:hypothetical protein KIL84_000447 [Mauremys mutica]
MFYVNRKVSAGTVCATQSLGPTLTFPTNMACQEFRIVDEFVSEFLNAAPGTDPIGLQIRFPGQYHQLAVAVQFDFTGATVLTLCVSHALCVKEESNRIYGRITALFVGSPPRSSSMGQCTTDHGVAVSSRSGCP